MDLSGGVESIVASTPLGSIEENTPKYLYYIDLSTQFG